MDPESWLAVPKFHGSSSLSLEIEEKYAVEVKSSLSNQIRSQLEEEVLAALELEVEEYTT